MGCCRQLWAIMAKNMIIKKNTLWKQTIWEFILPTLFGVILSFYFKTVINRFTADDMNTYGKVNVI